MSEQTSAHNQGPFKSVNQAWEQAGRHMFSVSRRTFFNWIGSGKPCPPRPDGHYHFDDIVNLARLQGWEWASVPAGLPAEGGVGGSTIEQINTQRARREKYKANMEELDWRKRLGEVVEREDMERQMVAMVAVLGSELENMAYSKALELIHVAGGDRQNEVAVQEHLLELFHDVMNAMARGGEYEVAFSDEDVMKDEVDDNGEANAALPREVSKGDASTEGRS